MKRTRNAGVGDTACIGPKIPTSRPSRRPPHAAQVFLRWHHQALVLVDGGRLGASLLAVSFVAAHSHTSIRWRTLPVTILHAEFSCVVAATNQTIWTPLQQGTPPVSPPRAEPSPLPFLRNSTCLARLPWGPPLLTGRPDAIPRTANTTSPIYMHWGPSRWSAADGTRCWLPRPTSLTTAAWRRQQRISTSSRAQHHTVPEVQVCHLANESGCLLYTSPSPRD